LLKSPANDEAVNPNQQGQQIKPGASQFNALILPIQGSIETRYQPSAARF
jgi:hypothetical protein